jgi:hypothetical protein
MTCRTFRTTKCIAGRVEPSSWYLKLMGKLRLFLRCACVNDQLRRISASQRLALHYMFVLRC